MYVVSQLSLITYHYLSPINMTRVSIQAKPIEFATSGMEEGVDSPRSSQFVRWVYSSTAAVTKQASPSFTILSMNPNVFFVRESCYWANQCDMWHVTCQGSYVSCHSCRFGMYWGWCRCHFSTRSCKESRRRWTKGLGILKGWMTSLLNPIYETKRSYVKAL